MSIFVQRIFSYTPCKPRHPLLRLLVGLIGLAVVMTLVVFGLFIGLGMLLFAAVRRLTRRTPTTVPPASGNVIDGEYSVIDKSRATLGLN